MDKGQLFTISAQEAKKLVTDYINSPQRDENYELELDYLVRQAERYIRNLDYIIKNNAKAGLTRAILKFEYDREILTVKEADNVILNEFNYLTDLGYTVHINRMAGNLFYLNICWE